MAKLEINAIFYSKQNLNVAYELKRACREVGISLIYAFEISELVRFLNDIKVGVIFIDSSTLSNNEHIIGFIKSYTNSKNSIIICLNTGDQELALSSSVNYVVHLATMAQDLKAIVSEIVGAISKQSQVEFNSTEVNTFLSNYLISIGLAPKHIGFVYIKQVIELALKHGVIGSLSKDIYPTVASKNKTFS